MTSEKLLAQMDRRMKLYNKIVLKTILKELKKTQLQNQKLMEANKILLNAIKSKQVITERSQPTIKQLPRKTANTPIQRIPGPSAKVFQQQELEEEMDYMEEDNTPMSTRDEYLNNSLKDQVGEDEVMGLLNRRQ